MAEAMIRAEVGREARRVADRPRGFVNLPKPTWTALLPREDVRVLTDPRVRL